MKKQNMERQASFLRCSKLNCYAEFNKMVQALSVHSRSFAHNPTGTLKQPDKGTGAEYNFYQTLSIMLQQVLSNPDQSAQKSELKMIYQWFSLNKPLAPQKVKPSAQRPKLTPSSRRTALLSTRPQTAPAALYGNNSSRSKTPVCPPSTPSISSFASSYMTRLIKPARPPSADPAQLMLPRSSTTSSTLRPATQPLPVRKDWLVDVAGNSNGGLTNTQAIANDRPSTSTIENNSSLLNGLTAGSVLDNATSVAAQMTMDRIMTKMDNSRVIFNGSSATVAKETATPNLSNGPLIVTNQDSLKQPKPSSTRSRSPSIERSVSMTILETIKEDDDETRSTTIMNTLTQKDQQQERQERQTGTTIEDTTSNNEENRKKNQLVQIVSDPQDDNNGKEQLVLTDSTPEITAQVPKVTISNKSRSRSLPLPGSSSSSRSSSGRRSSAASTTARNIPPKTTCRVQVVNLSLTSSDEGLSDEDNIKGNRSATRRPRKLAPIVAGFNQQHYRPRTVSIVTDY